MHVARITSLAYVFITKLVHIDSVCLSMRSTLLANHLTHACTWKNVWVTVFAKNMFQQWGSTATRCFEQRPSFMHILLPLVLFVYVVCRIRWWWLYRTELTYHPTLSPPSKVCIKLLTMQFQTFQCGGDDIYKQWIRRKMIFNRTTIAQDTHRGPCGQWKGGHRCSSAPSVLPWRGPSVPPGDKQTR